MSTFYLASCLDCSPPLPIPFSTRVDRNEWVAKHEQVHDKILLDVERRDEPAAVDPWAGYADFEPKGLKP